MKFGYARVSTPSQSLDRQLTALAAQSCDQVIQEKASAKDIENRPALKRLLDQLRPGDEIIFAEWDRATRSFLDGIAIMKRITDSGATLKVLDIHLDLADPLHQAIVGVLSAMAQKERERNLKRAEEGREEARKRGKRIGGPKPRLSPAQLSELRERHDAGERPAKLAASYGVSKATVSRVINQPWRYRR